MVRTNRGNFSSRCRMGVVLGIIVGVIAGILFSNHLLTAITTGIWIAFGLGVLALLILSAFVLVAKYNPTTVLTRCLCSNIICLLVGIFGTIAASLVALSVSLLPDCLTVAVIIGILTFFLVMLFISLSSLLLCFVCNSSRCAYNR